jgi:type I restriction enzyme, S subunit
MTTASPALSARGWSNRPLADFAVRRRGSLDPQKFPSEKFALFSIPAYDSGVPEYRTGSEIGSAKQVVEPGDVLISRIVPHIQRVWVVPKSNGKRQIASGEWIIFRGDDVEPRFLRHMLLAKPFHEQFMQTVAGVGGSLLRARPREVERIEIPVPSEIDEQRRIAAILDKADAIRLKRKQSLVLADDLLKSAFVHRYGDPATNPRKLRTKPIRMVGEVVTGNTPSRKSVENYGDGIEWIKSDNINTPNHFLTIASERLSATGERLARKVPAGSTLVTCIAGSPDCIGNAAMTDREVAFNQQINAIVPKANTDPYFLYAQVLVAKNLIQRASTNSMKGMVSKGRFQEIEFLAPDEDEQRAFGAAFRRMLSTLSIIQGQAEEAAQLFASLSQRAFRGEL